MTVRVWMRASELGDAGLVVEFDEAEGYDVHEDGTLLLTRGGDDDEDVQVGLVYPGRWDACVVLSATETVGDE